MALTTDTLSSTFSTITTPPALPALLVRDDTATLSCSLQNEDPDQGINARGCVCGSTTLPLLTITSSVTNDAESCSYTALPTSSVDNPITVSTTTYTSRCHLCTLVAGIANEPDCTSIPKCSAGMWAYSMTA